MLNKQIGGDPCCREIIEEPRYLPEGSIAKTYDYAATLHTLGQIEGMLYKISKLLAAIKLDIAGRE